MKFENKSLYELDLVPADNIFPARVEVKTLNRQTGEVEYCSLAEDLSDALRKVSWLACVPFIEVNKLTSIGTLFTSQTGRNLQAIIKECK